MNLPPVHGHGVPQILSQWKEAADRKERGEIKAENKRRYQQDFELREKNFKLQEDNAKEQTKQREYLRQNAAWDRMSKVYDIGTKYLKDDKTKEAGIAALQNFQTMYNKIFPDSPIDISNVTDPKDVDKTLKTQQLSDLTESYKLAKKTGDPEKIADYDVKKNRFDKKWGDSGFGDVDIREPKEDEPYKPQSPFGKVQQDIKKGVFTEEQYKESQVNKKPGVESDYQYQQKIKDIMKQNSELSEQEATGLVTGTIKVIQDEVSGTRYIVDTIKGTERPLKMDTADPQTPSPDKSETNQQGDEKPNQSLFSLADLVAGPGSAIKAAVSVPSGLVGGPVASETIQARQYVTTAKNDLIRALSINPRFPVGEIKRIEKEIDIQPKIWDNPQMFRDRMIAIDKYLRRRVAKEQSIGNNPKMPAQDRKDALGRAVNIENFIKLMGVPQQIKTIEEYNALEPDTQYIDPNGQLRQKGNVK